MMGRAFKTGLGPGMEHGRDETYVKQIVNLCRGFIHMTSGGTSPDLSMPLVKNAS